MPRKLVEIGQETKEGKVKYYVGSYPIYPNEMNVLDGLSPKTFEIETLTDVHAYLEQRAEDSEFFVPRQANAYIKSEFNGGTNRVREYPDSGKQVQTTVYAALFFKIPDFFLEEKW